MKKTLNILRYIFIIANFIKKIKFIRFFKLLIEIN